MAEPLSTLQSEGGQPATKGRAVPWFLRPGTRGKRRCGPCHKMRTTVPRPFPADACQSDQPGKTAGRFANDVERWCLNAPLTAWLSGPTAAVCRARGSRSSAGVILSSMLRAKVSARHVQGSTVFFATAAGCPVECHIFFRGRLAFGTAETNVRHLSGMIHGGPTEPRG